MKTFEYTIVNKNIFSKFRSIFHEKIKNKVSGNPKLKEYLIILIRKFQLFQGSRLRKYIFHLESQNYVPREDHAYT